MACARASIYPRMGKLVTVNCANDLENISASTVRGIFPAEMMTGKLSKLFPMLQPFGKIGYVAIRKKFKATWKQKSEKHLMVGYAKNHPADTYRMFNPVTEKISETRDVTTWAEWKRVDPKKSMSVFNENPELLEAPMGLDAVEVTEPSVDPEPDFHLIPDDEPDSEAGRKKQGEPVTTENLVTTETAATDTSKSNANEVAAQKARKLEREMKKLDINWNPGTDKPSMNKATIIETDQDGKESEKEVHFVFNTELMTEYGEPKTFQEAIERPEPEGEFWLHASGAEAMNFIKRKSWRKKLRSEVKDEGRKIIGTRWVYKRKDEQDGSVRYKGRIVSLGYMQVPGVDYTESFSPVGNDTSVRIVIGLALYHEIGQSKLSTLKRHSLKAT